MKTKLLLWRLLAGLCLFPALVPASTGSGIDLALGQTASPNPVMVGEPVYILLMVTNWGPGYGSSATVQDALPSGLSYSSASGFGSYNTNNGTWTFTPGSAGGYSYLSITAVATAAGSYLNTATLTGSVPGDTNSANNSASVDIVVNGTSNAPIVLTCSSNLTVPATSTNGTTVFFSVSATGGCSPPNVIANPPSGSTFPPGTTLVNVTASDSCGTYTNCSFTVTVNPPTYPPIVLACSSNLTVNATSSSGAVVYFGLSAYGGCNSPYIMATPPSGSTFPAGTTPVYVSASDGCGNTTNCAFSVTVVRPPISLNCSSNLTVTAVSSNGAAVYFSVSATGGCSPPNVMANPPSGSTFPPGMTLVTVTASDSCGTYTNCSFTVTVNPPTYPPIVLACSSNLTVNATSSGGATVYFGLSAYGGCNSPYIMATPPSGSTFPAGTTPVYVSASDGCGNTTNCAFSVTVVRPPISLNCSSNLTVTAVSSNGATVYFSVSATGGCSPPPSIMATPPSGSTFPVGTTFVNVTASDTCGTMTNCSFTVTVNPPTNSQVDLAVIKNVGTNMGGPYLSTNSFVTGQLIYFQIGIANNGSAVASNVVINDLLPPGLTYVTNDNVGNPFTYDPTNGVWSVGNVYPGGSIGYMYLVAMGSEAGDYTNTATVPVPSGLTDTNLANNTASAVANVGLPPADLQVIKTASTTNTPTGSQVVFQLQLSNLGPGKITNDVVVTDCLPPGFTYVTDSTYGGGGVGTYSPGTCWWTVHGIDDGLTYYLYITATATTAGTYTNTASVAVPAGVTDPNLTNNTSSVVVRIYPVYNISGYVRGCQSNGPAIPFTTINLSGAATGAALTDTNGYFVFSNLVVGTYTITPTQPGNVLSPGAAAVVLNANTNLPVFLGSIGQIRGRLSYGTNGPAVAGSLVQLTGAQTRTMETDANGVYAFTNTPPGNYIVTPVATNGYTYTPTNQSVTISATNCVAQANFAATNRTVLLVALEVVQVIQDWSNSVPLIQAKKAFVRAHLQLPTNGPAVLIQGAKLYGTAAGSPLPGSPLTPYAPGRSPDFLVQTTNAAALRGTFNRSLNFELPAGWTTGTIRLQLVATNNVTVVPTNTVPANSTVQATFVPTQVPPLKFVGFNWSNSATATFQTVNLGNYGQVPARVTAVYPVPDITAARSVLVPPATLNVPPVIPTNTLDPTAVEDVYDWALINANAKLIQMQLMDGLMSLYYGYTNWIYCGVLAGPSRGTLGWAGAYVTSANTLEERGRNVSSSFLQPTLYGPGSARQTIPHEIGHNLGFPHDVNFNIFGTTAGGSAIGSCNRGSTNDAQFPLFQPVPPPAGPLKPTLGPMTNGAPNSLVYGLDTYTVFNAPAVEPVADPANCFDLMSYCRSNSPLERWNSTYTYNGMRNAINNQFPPPPPPPPPGPPRQWRFIRGYVDAVSDLGGLLPSWSISSTMSGTPSATEGDLVAMMIDGSGQVIEAMPFTATPFIVEESEAEEDLFCVPMLDDPTVRMVEVVDLLTSNVVAALVAPTNLPTVSSVYLTTTNGGTFAGTGPLVVHWSAFDSNPNAQLNYLVQFSSDGGNTWDTLDVDWPNLSYQVDSLYLRATTQGLVRILASDGFNTSVAAYSSQFTIPNHPPRVGINSPTEGEIYIADGQIYLDATAVDPQDGPLDGANVQWSSSRDGVLGYGAVLNFTSDVLSEGTHVITVTATDAEALSSSAQVTINVVRLAPPSLSIQTISQSISNQLVLSWPAGATNYILESTINLVPAAWTTVTNAPAAADSSQTILLEESTTNRFFRLRLP